MKSIIGNTLAAVLCGLAFVAPAHGGEMEDEIARLQQDWAVANYSTPAGQAQKDAFESLAHRAAALSERYPQRAEPLVWEGIVLSTYAGAKAGLGALGLAKKARARLEAAMKLNADALDGSVYTSLGTLYYKVPRFPLGFGDHKKARALLERALALNPQGIDPNYFYGEFLYEEGEYTQAREHLQKALQAPPRPGRELADRGRREEVTALLKKMTARS